MTEYAFTATLRRPEGVGTWTYLVIPLDLVALFGTKGQLPVRGTINGHPYRSTALPEGDGTHYLVVKGALRAQIGATQGDTVAVTLARDDAERTVALPDDFAAALAGAGARSAFDRLAPSRRKALVESISAAKTDATRRKRIAAALAALAPDPAE